MSEADILATTYEDTVTVYRPASSKNADGETEYRTGMDGEAVHTAVPCALAKHSGGKLGQSSSVAKAVADFHLFVRPEIEIEPGDTLLVEQRGKQFLFTAGRADRQQSHNNVPLTPASEAVV